MKKLLLLCTSTPTPVYLGCGRERVQVQACEREWVQARASGKNERIDITSTWVQIHNEQLRGVDKCSLYIISGHDAAQLWPRHPKTPKKRAM